MRLEGKTAIITGASKGMGASEAKLFALEGAKVIACDIASSSGESLVSDIRRNGGSAQYFHCDVRRESDWVELVEETQRNYGAVDILVNNAGLSGTSADDLLSTEAWHMIMDVNATGVFLGTKTVAELMKDQGGGSIVNISSIMGFVGGEYGHPAYHASKGAVRLFSKLTAVQYAKDKIRVNSVHPGPINTTMLSNAYGGGEDKVKEWESLVPLGRLGNPIDIAYGVLFLASDESSFITGSELIIDGGRTAI